MKVSERFNLNATQFELDFVDIDTDFDLPLFVDPYFMGTRNDSFSVGASRTLRNFFLTLVGHIRSGNMEIARRMFGYLHEPNETCLGLSSGSPRGNAIGEIDGDKLFQSIAQSRAVETGLVEDIEDFKLFIDGIDKDKISDLTTNVIRKHLIVYTQQQCTLWNLPLQQDVQTGFYWNGALRRWENAHDQMLVIDDRRILLTPKSIVSYARKYTPGKYYSKFVLEFLQHEHVVGNSFLVQRRADGTPYVTKKSLSETVAPYSKDFLITFTENNPEVFREFKEWIKKSGVSITNQELVHEDPRFIAQYLTDKLRNVGLGGDYATRYHRIVVGILEFLFYPDLVAPIVEQEIHQGRKRIDITFDNAASGGFFFTLHNIHHIACQYVFVECKNYSKDVANPELDQLSGRFSVNRGTFGLLLFRQAENMELLLDRCRDTYNDGRGTIIPLCDQDLMEMLLPLQQGQHSIHNEFLSTRLRRVILG